MDTRNDEPARSSSPSLIPTPVCQWRRGLTSCAGRHLGALRNPLGSSSPAPTSPRSTLSSRFSAPQTNLALSFPLCVHGPGYGRGSLTGAPESTPASLVAIPPSAGGTLMQTRAWGPRLSGPLSSGLGVPHGRPASPASSQAGGSSRTLLQPHQPSLPRALPPAIPSSRGVSLRLRLHASARCHRASPDDLLSSASVALPWRPLHPPHSPQPPMSCSPLSDLCTSRSPLSPPRGQKPCLIYSTVCSTPEQSGK